MDSSPDLKIVEQDVRQTYEKLDGISDDFKNDAATAQDIGAALGHPKLAERLASFSESWRVNREHMVKAFEALSQELRQKLDVFDQLDKKIGGNQDPTSDPKSNPDHASTDPSNGAGGSLASGSGSSTTPTQTPTPVTTPVTPPLSTGADSAGTPTPPHDLMDHAAQGPLQTNGVSAEPGAVPDVTVDTIGGGFQASVAVGVGGTAATASVLMTLYGAWQRSKSAPSAASGPDDGSGLGARARLLQEFEQMRLGNRGGTVELVADSKHPDDVMAILRGQDGSVSKLNFADVESGRGADGVTSPSDPIVGPAAPMQPGTVGSSTQEGQTAGSLPSNPIPSGEPPTSSPGGGSSLSSPSGASAAAGLGPTLSPVTESPPPGSVSPVGLRVDTQGVSHASSSAPTSPDFSQGSVEPSLAAEPSHAVAGTMAGAGMVGIASASSASSSHQQRPDDDRRLDPRVKSSEVEGERKQ